MTIEVAPEDTNDKEVEIDVVNNNNNDQSDKSNKNNKNNKSKNKYVSNNKKYEKNTKKLRVKCSIPELKDMVFDCNGFKQAEEYKKAKEALETYVTSNWSHGTDIRQCLEKLEVISITVPDAIQEPAGTSDAQKAINKRINEKRIDAFVQRENALEENIGRAYKIVWDMCTDEMHAKLKAIQGFEANISDKMDVITLLEQIRKIMYNYQEKRYVHHNMLMTWRKFYELKQLPHESVQEYYERFKLQVKVLESVGGSLGRDEQLLVDAGMDPKRTDTMDKMYQYAEIAKEKFLAYKFIYDADHARYGHVKEGLHSDYNKDYEKTGKKYPDTMEAAYNLLLASKARKVQQQRSNVAFVQAGKSNGNNNKEWKKKIQCYKCKKYGHFANECQEIGKND